MRGKENITSRNASVSALTLLITTIVGFSLCSSVYAWSYKEAAAPYKGTSIRILDEVTPLQETMKALVPQFEKETGIKTEYELLNHFDVISKGQADMLSGRGHYDAVMLHSLQLGPLLDAGVVLDITGMLGNTQLTNPDLGLADLIEPPYSSTSKHQGKQYGFLNWNYNNVYWARNDLLSHAGEKSAFKAKYGYDLGPAKTMQQMRDIAEFFTRKKGQQLAGATLESDFYGIVMEGIKGGTTFPSLWFNFLTNWGGGLLDANGAPAFDTPENIAALRFWADLWKYSPPGQAEYSLIDVPTVMGNGIAAQTIAWSDFVFGIDVPGKSALHGKFVYGNIPRNEAFDGPMTTAGEPSIVVISKASKNPEAVYLFMQWMVDRATQEKLLNAGGGGVPIRNSSWDLPVMNKPGLASLAAAMRESMKGSYGKPKMPNFFEVYDEMASIIQQIGLGQMTPEEGVKVGQEKLLKICKKCLL